MGGDMTTHDSVDLDTPPAPRRWLTAAEVAERLNVSTATLTVWRREHKGPPWKKLVSRIRYLESEVAAWEDGSDGSEPGGAS